MINNTIVVYENDTVERQAVKVYLEAEGYTVLLAEEEIGLGPSQSGREKLPNPHIPIITLSGRHQGMRGLPHGNDMIVTKPCNPQELKQFVQRLRADAESSC